MSKPLWLIEGTMAKAERDAIIAALQASDYYLTAAAARLRIGRSTLYRLIDAYQVPIDSADGDKKRRDRARQGRPVAKTRPAPASSAGGEADRASREASKVVHVDGAWYLLQADDRDTSE